MIFLPMKSGVFLMEEKIRKNNKYNITTISQSLISPSEILKPKSSPKPTKIARE